MNRDLAEKLLTGKKGGNEANPLGDDRFAAMFSNPDFTVDPESEVGGSVMVGSVTVLRSDDDVTV